MKYPDKLKKKEKSCPRRLTTVGLERQPEGRDKTRDPGNLSAAFEALFTSMIWKTEFVCQQFMVLFGSVFSTVIR